MVLPAGGAQCRPASHAAGHQQVELLKSTHKVAVVHKPAGVPFHRDVTTEGGGAAGGAPGIMQLVRSQHPELGQLYPVHRLDRVTSGALVLARSRAAAAELIAQFRERRVDKYYVALSARRPAKKMGSVVGDMSKGRRGSWMLERSTKDPAITRFTSCGVGRRGLRALLLKPETGKTHQLRVAMKSLGAPVLGDARYADASAAAQEDRCYLHCAALRLSVGGEPLQVVCPPASGKEFLSAEYAALFDGWFPADLEQDYGVWFSEQSLLRSGPLLV